MQKKELDQRGQFGIMNLFVTLIIWFAITVALITVAVELIVNSIVPAITGRQFATEGELLLWLGLLIWFIIPIALIGAALRGQRVEG